MTTKTKLLAFIALVLIVAGVAWVVTQPSTNPTGSAKPRVAVNIPLSGPIAAATGPYPNGLRMGIEDGLAAANSPRDAITVDSQDNEGKPAQTVSVFQKQQTSPVDVYVSGVSDMTMAIIDQLDQSATPHFLVCFDAFMPDKGKNRLRILPNFKLEGPLYLNYVKEQKAKRVYSLSHSSPVNEELFSAIIEPGLTAMGVDFKREKVDWGTKDFRTLAIKARDYKPDVILIGAFSAETYPFLSALRTAGVKAKIYAGMDFLDLLHNDTPRAELIGVSFSAPYIEIPARADAKKDWAARYERAFGSKPSYIAAYAYDTGQIIAKAYMTDKKLTTESILRTLPYEGVTGRIELDSNRDLRSTLTVGWINEKGEVAER